jgi:hypothetical protein
MITIAALVSTEHVFAHGQGPGDANGPGVGTVQQTACHLSVVHAVQDGSYASLQYSVI